MKKVAVLLAMLFGASVSVLSYADSSQPNSDNSQQTQPQADKQGGNDNNSGNSTGGSSNDDDDTAS